MSARDKISKLLNMTPENGCSEDEAETAFRMAVSIAAREGINLDSCRSASSPKPKIAEKMRHEKLKPHQALAAEAAAILYGVECDVYNLGHEGICFTGREDLIELAEEMMFWLMRQVEQLYKQHLPSGLSQSARSEYRKTFKAACASRMVDRAYDMMRKLKEDQATAKTATGQNALVVQNYFDTLQSEIRDFHEAKYRRTPAEQAAIDARIEQYRAQRAKWEKDHPEEAAAQRKQQERDAKKELRRSRKRKGRQERRLPTGSGTSSGFAAGNNVKLRKDIV